MNVYIRVISIHGYMVIGYVTDQRVLVQKFRRNLMYVTPFVYLGAFGFVFHLTASWWIKAVLLLLVFYSLRALFRCVLVILQ